MQVVLSDERTGLYIAVYIAHWSESRRALNYILLSHLTLPTLDGQVPVFISPRNRVVQLYPRILCVSKSNWTPVKIFYYRRSVGQSVLVSGHHPGPATKLSFYSMEIILRYLRVFIWVLYIIFSAVIPWSEPRRTHNHTSLSRLRLRSPSYIARDRLAQVYTQAQGSLSIASYDSQGYSGGIQSRLRSVDSSMISWRMPSAGMLRCVALVKNRRIGGT
jgi:hypothetical protein